MAAMPANAHVQCTKLSKANSCKPKQAARDVSSIPVSPSFIKGWNITGVTHYYAKHDDEATCMLWHGKTLSSLSALTRSKQIGADR